MRFWRQKGDARKTSSTAASVSEKRPAIIRVERMPLAMILKGRSSVEWDRVDMTRFISCVGTFNCAEKNCLPELQIDEVRCVGGGMAWMPRMKMRSSCKDGAVRPAISASNRSIAPSKEKDVSVGRRTSSHSSGWFGTLIPHAPTSRRRRVLCVPKLDDWPQHVTKSLG